MIPSTSFPLRRGKALALSGLFVLLLGLPTLDLAFHLDKNPVRAREPLPFPELKLDWASLKKYPGDLEWYLRNSMGFQGTLLRLNGLFKYYVLESSANPQVVLGSEGWLFLEGDIKDYRHVSPFTPEQLKAWVEVIGARKRWLEARGIRYFIVACPDKEMVYSDYLPTSIKRAKASSRVEQFVSAVRSDLDVDVLDLTEPLRAERHRERLYHKTDTHWNDLGGHVAYRAIVQALARWYPGITPIARSEWELRDELMLGGDLARIIGVKVDLKEHALLLRYPKAQARLAAGGPITYQTLDVTETPSLETKSDRADIKTALFVRDSFGEALLPMLSEHVGRAKWLWTDYKFPAGEIDAMRPEIVVEQWVGRTLSNYKPENPPELNLGTPNVSLRVEPPREPSRH